MITKFTSPTRKRPTLMVIIAALLVIVGLGGFWIFSNLNKGSSAAQYPLYLNFAGNYVFSVPKEYSVDEQSIPGIQLVYSGTFTVKTLADLYDVGGTSVQALAELKDQNFKDFVEKTFIPNLKKDAVTDDVQVKYSKERGADVAKLTVKKDGAVFRFVHLRAGKHPVVFVAKEENDTLKKMAETTVDVEDSVFKNEVEAIKTAITKNGELARDQKVDELYDNASPDLRAGNSKEEVLNALKEAADYLKGNVTLSGGSLSDAENFSAAMRFNKLDDKEQKSPGYGSLALKKIDGQWKLEMLGLPSPNKQQ